MKFLYQQVVFENIKVIFVFPVNLNIDELSKVYLRYVLSEFENFLAAYLLLHMPFKNF